MSRRDWLFGLTLIAVTMLVYLPAWNGKPIWDDEIHITPPALRSVHGLARIWTEPSAAPQYYPVLHTIFWLEYKLWDGWTLPYHLLTILLHAVLALFVFQILRKLGVPGAWLAAIVFALHPVNVESVAWLSEIKNTLSGVLAAAAMLAYLNYEEDRRVGRYLLALVVFVVGLMTKTAIVALPVVLLAVAWWKRGKLSWANDIKPLTPFFGVALLFGLVTVWVEQAFCVEHGETFPFSFIDRCLTAGRLFWFYLGNLFWPVNLTIIYPRWTISARSWWQYTFPFATIALFVGLWIIRDKSRGPLAAALCFVALLFPVLGFFNLSYFMYCPTPSEHSAIFRADHFQYLADIVVIAPVCAGVAWWWRRSSTQSRIFLSVCGLALLAFLAGSTWAYSRNYRDNETCFRDVLSKNSNSATAHNNLGNALLKKGSVDEAISHFEKALEVEPNYQFGQYNVGAALAKKGDAVAAIARLKLALAADPNYSKSYYSLGTALAQTGQTDEAIASYRRALQLEPDLIDAHTNLANLLLEKGDIENALGHYRQALRLEPDSPMTHYNLAVGLARNGQRDQAVAELQTVLKLQFDYPDARELLTTLLQNQ